MIWGSGKAWMAGSCPNRLGIEPFQSPKIEKSEFWGFGHSGIRRINQRSHDSHLIQGMRASQRRTPQVLWWIFSVVWWNFTGNLIGERWIINRYIWRWYHQVRVWFFWLKVWRAVQFLFCIRSLTGLSLQRPFFPLVFGFHWRSPRQKTKTESLKFKYTSISRRVIKKRTRYEADEARINQFDNIKVKPTVRLLSNFAFLRDIYLRWCSAVSVWRNGMGTEKDKRAGLGFLYIYSQTWPGNLKLCLCIQKWSRELHALINNTKRIEQMHITPQTHFFYTAGVSARAPSWPSVPCLIHCATQNREERSRYKDKDQMIHRW